MNFYIVNEHDKPCARLLTVEHEGLLYYIDGRYKNFAAQTMERATEIRAYGFKVTEVDGGVFEFEKVSPESATYADGQIRRWQGETSFTMLVPGKFPKTHA